MSLRHGMLGLLNYGSMTGYELDKAFKESLSFFWQAQTSQIYRELAAMERKGWVNSEQVIQNEKPNKRVYTITGSGKEELKSWLCTSEADIDDAMRVRSAFLMRVFFAGEMENGEALSMLRKYREACVGQSEAFGAVPESIAQYGALVDNEDQIKYWKVVALFGEISYRAGLEWVNRAIALLEGECK
ncbi:MAG: PadR family transcriptional regulator [Oscillospiraceae bacterium]|nr:PadR family transcriptional regulator [Oscillospiraceae bacterium]